MIAPPAVVWDLDEQTYHADPIGGSLSVSGAKKLLPPHCPAVYRWERDHPVTSDVFDFGHAAHRLVLGKGADIGVVEADSWRTKAAQGQRDEVRADGLVPILAADYAHAVAMAEAVRAHPLASLVLSDGDAEVSFFFTDEETGVVRRARADFLRRRRAGQRLIVADYKTTVSAFPDSFGASAAKFGYAMQAAWYLDAVQACGLVGDDDEPPAFVFVAQEKQPPYLVSVIELDADAMRVGDALNRRALRIFRECSDADTWPGYPADDITLVSLPAWFVRQMENVA